ncbi:hypothetical protein R5R35_014517 [Gryllus longicercus]|uniref:Uncharacterized protein n=1 Tax=Gryllus longicercus TaxID=2509291 RepID=A0AAN9Z7K2_9ORTH
MSEGTRAGWEEPGKPRRTRKTTGVAVRARYARRGRGEEKRADGRANRFKEMIPASGERDVPDEAVSPSPPSPPPASPPLARRTLSPFGVAAFVFRGRARRGAARRRLRLQRSRAPPRASRASGCERSRADANRRRVRRD